jgi:serine/threonine protein kinase
MTRTRTASLWTFAITSLALFMVALDNLVVTTALPVIKRDLGASLADLQWMVNAYTLTFAVLLITGAALGDRFGRKRVFLIGMAIFIGGSALAALSPSTDVLILARAIQGVGGAIVTPLTLTILSAAVPPERRAVALGAWGGIAGLAIAIGPLVGGAIAEGLDWHWIFWLNVPIGLIVIPLAYTRLTETYGPEGRLDIPGLALISGGLLALVWGVINGNDLGWSSPQVVGSIAAGVALLVAFVVWEARHALLRRPTAVKPLAPGTEGERALARFEREVQLTAGLTHPSTIAIYDYGRTPEGIFYYAMEYLPGLPLDRVILDDGPQPEPRVVHLVEQICASLAEAHRIGLVHRDIKPANVMLCERGGTYDVVKVLDFGLVKELGSEDDSALTAANHVVGTPLYMAPEAVSSAANVGPRSDVYAVGAVAYALVTGHQVFSGTSGVEILGHHLHTAPISPSERLGRALTPFLVRLILACLAKRPEDRPADAGELLSRLEEGWTGASWTQRDAREWWQTRAPAMLESRRASEASVSRGPRLEVDVASRVRSASSSLPELEFESGVATRVRPQPPNPPKTP